MKASKAQVRALTDVRDTGNFGLDVRYATKAAVCGRGWVEAGVGIPLRLSAVGQGVLEAAE